MCIFKLHTWCLGHLQKGENARCGISFSLTMEDGSWYALGFHVVVKEILLHTIMYNNNCIVVGTGRKI